MNGNRCSVVVSPTAPTSTVRTCSTASCSVSLGAFCADAESGCDGGWIQLGRGWVYCNKVYGPDTSRTTVQPTDIWIGRELEMDGWYRFEVAAIDTASNRDSTAATFTWELGRFGALHKHGHVESISIVMYRHYKTDRRFPGLSR